MSQCVVHEIAPEIFFEIGRLMSEVSIPHKMQRVIDSALHLLGSKQDIVHTVHRTSTEGEEWDLAIMDGHGSTQEIDPSTGKLNLKFNFTLYVIQEMIKSGELDAIMALDIYAPNDPAVEFQRALSKKCIEMNRGMTHVGATFSLIQIRHDFVTKKITVNVLTVGDSPVTIYRNGELILRSIDHDHKNKMEMDRLKREGRINSPELLESNSFKMLDADTIVQEIGQYILAGPCQLAMTQSLGHIQYLREGRVIDEKGVFGLDPFKWTMVFDDTDDLNIKGFSDGVSDVVMEDLQCDADFMRVSNATETADLAKMRWQKTWKYITKTNYSKGIEDGISIADMHQVNSTFGRGADDISCVSWIQKRV